MFSLNFTSREPIYEQLYNSVVRFTSLGILLPNEKLPPVRNLASQLSINPNTVSKAYQMLERDGYIFSVVGKGTFINPDIKQNSVKIKIALEDLQKSTKKAMAAGADKNQIIVAVQGALGTQIELRGEIK